MKRTYPKRIWLLKKIKYGEGVNKKMYCAYKIDNILNMRIIFSILIIFLLSCNRNVEFKYNNQTDFNESKSKPEFALAFKFINDYVRFCDSQAGLLIIDTNWIDRNQILTENFKNRYHYILDSALKVEPDIGLDFDPIFDGNNYPDSFELLNYDNNSGYTQVKGKNWPEFIVTLKVIRVGNKWYVDGSGIINIPIDKRITRGGAIESP